VSRCPSLAAQRMLADQDAPEACPVCGADNCTEAGDWVCAEAPAFCSVACRDTYVAWQREDADALARDLAEEARLADEWRAEMRREVAS
jgi:hypothetical protein